MGRKSKQKGKVGEREAAAELSRLFRVPARRGQQFAGGGDSPDVVVEIHDVHIEVKRCEAIRLYAAIDQATKDGGGKVPLVLHRQNNKPWLAVVPLEELPRLAVQLYLVLTSDNDEVKP